MTLPPPKAAFDSAKLLAALQARKAADGISWRELSRQAGMPQSYGIASKLRRGAQPTAGVLTLLLRYLGESDIGPYTSEEAGPGANAPAA